jgi:hypothetical protein
MQENPTNLDTNYIYPGSSARAPQCKPPRSICYILLAHNLWRDHLMLHLLHATNAMSHILHATNAMSHTLHAPNAIAMYAINARKSDVVSLSSFLNTFYLRKAGLKVCPKCFFTTTVNSFFLPSHKKRHEKQDSFYTAKRVSSCQRETIGWAMP